MTTKRIANLLLLPFLFVPLMGQSHAATAPGAKLTAQQIQVELEKCLSASDANDLKTIDCYESACEKMDQRMNEVYRALIAHLSPRQKEALQDAQRKWLRFRDAEEKLSNSLNQEDGMEEGTLDRVQGMAKSYELLKQRTEDLEKYLKAQAPGVA